MMKFFSTLTKSVSYAGTHARKTEAEGALSEIKILWNSGKLNEALDKLDQVEKNHPSCSKAAKIYRGKIGYELLEKSGNLPPKPSYTYK